ncbi:MAG: DUF433 domain-containing protein [Saprospiraceae bacterium]|nr:MAG: DUF433 domain-containing protein [Saprospiraceae bacterium]
MFDLQNIIVSNPNILGGTPVFKGTRVPVKILFQHLEKNIPLDEFLDDFPTVSQEQAVSVLNFFENILTQAKLNKLYEIAA